MATPALFESNSDVETLSERWMARLVGCGKWEEQLLSEVQKREAQTTGSDDRLTRLLALSAA